MNCRICGITFYQTNYQVAFGCTVCPKCSGGDLIEKEESNNSNFTSTP